MSAGDYAGDSESGSNASCLSSGLVGIITWLKKEATINSR